LNVGPATLGQYLDFTNIGHLKDLEILKNNFVMPNVKKILLAALWPWGRLSL
jgi:hypothetical protein